MTDSWGTADPFEISFQRTRTGISLLIFEVNIITRSRGRVPVARSLMITIKLSANESGRASRAEKRTRIPKIYICSASRFSKVHIPTDEMWFIIGDLLPSRLASIVIFGLPR